MDQKAEDLMAIMVHLFCLLVGIGAAGACAWVVATGQLFTLDGLALVLGSLSVAAFFVGNTAWAAYTGELGELVGRLRGKSEKPGPGAQAGPQ